jgi:2-polyprenyl-3-methyl-5-hydroxy-6-metoxy-1,4-benzoquinol methylase
MLHKGKMVYQKEGTQIIDCEICGFKHINPVPSDTEIDSFYKKTYFNQIREGKKGMNLKHFLEGENEANSEMQWLKSTSYSDVNEILSHLIDEKSRNLCDVGCGSGFFLKYMSNLGWNSIGIEPSENADYESQNLRIFNTTLDVFISQYKEYNHFFDAVTLFGVLEHATNPSGMIDSVKQLLKPGGILFVNVPNDFSVLQLAANKSLNIEPWWPSIPDHINYFSMDSLKKFLESTGFSTIEATTDFPMELFLLMGENYIQNNKIGSICHQKRKQFEQSIPSILRHELYSCFARHSMGRCCIVYASQNYPSEKSS